MDQNSNFANPVFGTEASAEKVILDRLQPNPIDPNIAYRLVKDQLIDEGNARQNMATFCQTYMEPEAQQLMAETLDKNAIDKSEYPSTAGIEQSCVHIISNLWNIPDVTESIGTSTVGSSEACMLGGMAMKFRWKKNAEAKGLDLTKQRPNLVISSGYQVCWEKFCIYWDIELRAVPMDEAHMSLDIDKVTDYIDDYTIGVVGILGITYTGKYDDIKGLDQKIEEYNAKTGNQVGIHVDGASGGMFAPFIYPDLEWDFRLKNVVSINTSGHKYGLVYPGIGWIVWRNQDVLPKELIFDVSYLGGNMPTMAINFSRSASQIIGQYYNFYRYGFAGYKAIHLRTQAVAMMISKYLEKTGLFEIYNNGENLPVVCYRLKEDANVNWNLYDLSDRLQMRGWQVPAYPLPVNLQNVEIQRFVCRGDFGMNMADALIRDIGQAIDDLNKANVSMHAGEGPHVQGFTH